MAYNDDILKFGRPKLKEPEEYAAQYTSQGDPFGRMPAQQSEDDIEQPATMSPEDFNSEPAEPGSDADLENEMNDNEDIGNEALRSKPVPKELAEFANRAIAARQSHANPMLDKYQQFMDQYKALQGQREKGNLFADLAQAGGQVGQAMAGKYSGNFKPDESGIAAIRAGAGRPVNDFENAQVVQSRGINLEDEKQARDPSSKMSETYRTYARDRLKMDVADDVSAHDLILLLKSVGKPAQTKFQQLPMVNQKTGEKIMGTFNPSSNTFQDSQGNLLDTREWIRDYRAQSFIDPKTQERLGFSAGTGKVTGALTGAGVNAPIVPEKPGDLQSEQPIQINRSFLNAQQAKQVDHAREKFIQEVRDDRNSLNANDRVLDVLEAGRGMGDLPREIQDQLNRAFGQKGHISDAQLGGLLGKADWKNRVTNYISLGATGKLTDENRQFLIDVAKLIRDQNQKYINRKSQIYTTNLHNDLKSAPNLKKYNFTPDSIKGMLGVESAVNPDEANKVMDPQVQEFANDHYQGDYNKALHTLTKRGYKPSQSSMTPQDQQNYDNMPAIESPANPEDEE